MLESSLLGIALALVAITLAAVGWSVAYPNRRIWPPQSYGPETPIIVWGVTCTLSGAIIALGILGWGQINISDPFRYVLGPLLIILGNLAVWTEVIQFGIPQTSGAVGSLKVNGFYRYSRNPQYVADIVILIGWALLCASANALPVIIGGILILVAAPIAEETWLEKQYGRPYLRYKTKVRRYL